MALPSKRSRWPSLSLLLGLLLGAYYLLVFQPLARRVGELDRELNTVWERFAATNQAASSAAAVDLEAVDHRLRQLRNSATNLTTVGRLVRGRMDLPAEVRAKLNEPFQLIDFQNERVQRIDQLSAVAKEKGVALEPGATNGLPEYAADMPQASLLWSRLYLTHQALLGALHCKVAAIRGVTQLPVVTYRSARDGSVFLLELPLRIELAGPMEAMSKFLVSLPLRGPELKPVGLETLTNKPAMYLDQVLLRKGAPERPHEVQLELTLSGLVPWREEREKGLLGKP